MAKIPFNDKVKKVFYNLLEDVPYGVTLSLDEEELSYVRFNYVENGKLFGEQTEEDYLGNPEKYDEEYDAEFSNGSANYIPTLKVDDKEEFFNVLSRLVKEYILSFRLDNAIHSFGEDSVIKHVILTIFGNARYVDYEHPIPYLKRYFNFFYDWKKLDNQIEDISLLGDSRIETQTKKEQFGYETPYYFESAVVAGDNKYYLPNISYGISRNKCYIYAIQNKHQNEDNSVNKKIKRMLNRVNANVVNDTPYDNKESILGVPPSFVLALTLFLKSLNNQGINDVEVITFLPDRYFEKKATEEYHDFDADLIQSNLTQRMVLLFYRIQAQLNDLEISYPIYDEMNSSSEVGENLVVKLSDNLECTNNPLLEEVISKMSHSRER